jgi:hypothetical protein
MTSIRHGLAMKLLKNFHLFLQCSYFDFFTVVSIYDKTLQTSKGNVFCCTSMRQPARLFRMLQVRARDERLVKKTYRFAITHVKYVAQAIPISVNGKSNQLI